MSAIFLTEEDVRELINMQDCVEVVDEAFRRLASGQAHNMPRARVKGTGCLLHTMSASADWLELVGWKTYTTTRASATFHVAVYDSNSGSLQALIEADWLGRLRTGAATGVATKYMAREDASTVGLIGTGKQAETQLIAVCCVREIDRVEVFGRDAERRRGFCSKLSEVCGTEVIPVDSPSAAVADKGIVITATTSKQPVFAGAELSEGTHVNAIGSNFMKKTELDVDAVRRAGKIACDSIEQCRIEAGDFREALEQGITDWDRMHELADVVSGNIRGRDSSDQVTLFKSVGIAVEDVALAGELLKRAREQNRGVALPIPASPPT